MINRLILCFVLPLVISSCASVPPEGGEDQAFTADELDYFLPKSCRKDLQRYLVEQKEGQWGERLCGGKENRRQACASFTCSLEPSFACRWEEGSRDFRDLVYAEILSKGEWKEEDELCPGYRFGGEFTKEGNERLCERNIFFEDRVICLFAYVENKEMNLARAKKFLQIACSGPRSFCSMDGKSIGRLKSPPPKGRKSGVNHSAGNRLVHKIEYVEAD
jgi:hypothetical protein